MLYGEYLKCARKHLLACQELFDSYNDNQRTNESVWLELYYLSGYIIEAIVVYSVYKLYNWNPEKDIQNCYNWSFTRETGIDFYRLRRHPRTKEIIVPDDLRNRDSQLSIEGHDFKSIVKKLLESNPSMDSVPYIGNGYIDEDIRRLIENWKPEVRYTYDSTNYRGINGRLNLQLDYDVIKRLINTCRLICSNIHI